MKKEQEFVFVLGAQDPEMREIERILKSRKIAHYHASTLAIRCKAHNAYAANGVIFEERSGKVFNRVIPPRMHLAFVECQVDELQPILRIDHHNPGDPGYEAPPEKYLEGSSLAQLLNWLEIEPSADQRLLAAADHCLLAAYQGRCDGVDPGDLLFMRTAWQAKIMNRSLSDVINGVMNAAEACRKRKNTDGEAFFNDPTRTPSDLPEGSAYSGVPVRYRALKDGMLKEMLKGANPDRIIAFMKEHEEAGHRVYGNPYRGYAGAYI